MINNYTLRDIITDHKLCKVQKETLQSVIDKIEQGTLIELPCKVGDTVWLISPFSKIPTAITVPNIYTLLRWKEDEVFGSELFLTREEAEKGLKELQWGGRKWEQF